MAKKLIVNSWNEWDELEEVIVGSAEQASFDLTEPACHPKLRGSKKVNAIPFPSGSKSKALNDKANEELAGFSALLESQGVKVLRPELQDFTTSIKTPNFEAQNQYCAVCPRDVMITFGQEILEATMSKRARFFEYLPYRKIIYDYWYEDPDMIWNSAPKPSMADDMYREDFWNWTLEERHARMHESEFCITQREVIFDAADCCRFGRDILVQESMTTNRAGIRWLKKHLEPRGFRVHPVHFPYDLFPSHIDCNFVPLREGLILTNPERPILKEEEKMFLDNDWKFITAPQPTSTNEEMPTFCQSSKWLSMNVFSISPTKIVCEEQEKPLQDLLDKNGFEVYTLPFRNVFEYGGSFHCATWDIRRTGGCENYFPNLEYEPLSRLNRD